MACGNIDGVMHFLDVVDCEVVAKFEGKLRRVTRRADHGMTVRAMSYSGDGKHLVSVSDDRHINFYDW